jgi:uncharacterized protein YegP (UPF0339 family)
VTTVRRTSLLLILAGLIVSVGLGTSLAQDKPKSKPKADSKAKAETPPSTAAGLTFELYKDAGGKYRWRLKDGEGTNIGIAPHGYDTKAECQKGIDAIKNGAARAKVEDKS